MVCRKGFEPLTPWLKVKCSTTELAAHMVPLERFKLPTFWFVARRAVQLRQRGIWWPKAGSNCRTEIFSLLLFLLSYRAILALSQLSRICVSPELIAGIEPSLVTVPWWMSWSWTNNLAERGGVDPHTLRYSLFSRQVRRPRLIHSPVGGDWEGRTLAGLHP